MKKIIIGAFLIILLAIALPFLSAMRNWFSDEKPWDYKSSVWVSKDPYFVLTVDEEQQAICTAGRGADTVSFRVDNRGNYVVFLTTDEDGYTQQLAHGSGSYSSKRFVVKFSDGFTIPGIYEDPIYEIVFIRQS